MATSEWTYQNFYFFCLFLVLFIVPFFKFQNKSDTSNLDQLVTIFHETLLQSKTANDFRTLYYFLHFPYFFFCGVTCFSNFHGFIQGITRLVSTQNSPKG